VYLFFEHVQAGESDQYMRWMQFAVSPILNLLGNGCTFRKTWVALSSSTDLPEFEVSMTKFMADVTMPFLRPHIRGRAVKFREMA
jgi:hypothetical protein